MKRSTAYFALLLILVVIIAVLGFLIVQRRTPEKPEPAAPTEASDVHPPVEETMTDAPEVPSDLPTAPTEVPVTPPPTEAPVFETRPPVETEEPKETESPAATPMPEASGSFRSDTGTGLNLAVAWKIAPDSNNGSTRLYVDITAESYSFFTSALYQSVVLTVNGTSYTANSPEISYDGTDKLLTPFAAFEVPAPPSGSTVSVTWRYRGSYSGKQLDNITASGTIAY